MEPPGEFCGWALAPPHRAGLVSRQSKTMKLLPRVLLGQSVNASERHVRHLLAQAFEDRPGVAFHSLNLPNHDYKRLSEADFVLVRPGALLVLEVKGGDISVSNDGMWRFASGRGEAIVKSESPMKQAESGMWAVGGLLRAAKLKEPAVIGYAVVFPFTNWPKGKMPELPDDLVIDRSACIDVENFERAITVVEKFWTERAIVSGRKPYAIDVAKYENALRPSFHAVESLASITRGLKEESAQLTQEQISALDAIAANPRIVLEGPAGTGKTLLCAAWTNASVRSGERVLLVVPTMGLRSLMEQACPGATVVLADDVQGIMHDGESYHCAIIDEGQCFGTAEFLTRLDAVLVGGIEAGKWRWAMDRVNQADSPMDQNVMDVLRRHSTRCDLSANLRSARPIVEHLRLMLGADMTVGRMISFGITPRFDDVDSASIVDHATGVLDDWISQGVVPSDITVITASSSTGTLIGAMPMAAEDSSHPRDTILVTDANSFRGLESPWVLVVLDEPNPDGFELSRWLYLAMSRARVALCVLIGSRARQSVASIESINFLR